MHGSTLHEKIFDVRMRQIAPIALILVGAVGCTSSSSGGPTSSPSPTQPVSTSASPTPTAPSTSASSTPSVATTGPNVRPGEKPPAPEPVARSNTPAGADAYARYWMRTLDWAYATTDSSATRSAYAASCVGCAAFAKNIIDSTKNARDHFLGGRIVVTSSAVQVNDNHAGSTAVIDLTFNQSSLKVVNTAGNQVDAAPAIRAGTFRNWLRWTGSRWVIVDWKRASR